MWNGSGTDSGMAGSDSLGVVLSGKFEVFSLF